jgi:hypothetical protein
MIYMNQLSNIFKLKKIEQQFKNMSNYIYNNEF